MRNLKLQYCRELAVKIADIRFVLLNPNAGKENDLVYFTTASKLYAFHTTTCTVEEIVEVPGIVSAEYLSLDNLISLATSEGEVLTVEPQTKEINEGTYCDVGIECMQWSPDQEVVAFITKTHNLVVMTCTYDSIAEHTLNVDCGGEEQFMNVGWGKKETQFHGSEGKSAAKQKSEFQVPANVEDLPQNIEITWRADAAYFAVSFVSDAMGRMFKVFDKEGKLQYTSEKMNDLQASIAWRPSGTWIAVPQRLPNKSVVALFEKNGLRHREIVLPFALDVEPIVSLKWNADSDILMIATAANNLYFYTIGNYHWYLKQVLSFGDPSNSIIVCDWDNRIDEERTLHIMLENGKYLVYKWRYAIDKFESSGVVAVIDGKKLLLTNFSKCVVPPPMCSKELTIDNYINAVTFVVNKMYELQLCVYDSAACLHIYKAPTMEPLNFEKLYTLRADNALSQLPQQLGNMFALNEGYSIATTSAGNNTNLLLLSHNTDAEVYKLASTLQINGLVTALCSGSAEDSQFFVQTHVGLVQQISIKAADNTLKVSNKCFVELTHPADQLQWFSSCLISLRANQCLYIDAQRIDENVTSFCAVDNGLYLAYTKMTALYFLRLHDKSILRERKMERGSKLITIIDSDARTVLQMPRGNLEAICPRILLVRIIFSLLDKRLYKDAMELMRKQRINLNLICDQNMEKFVKNIDLFLEQIENQNWLNLFISDLRNENVVKTMYANNYVEQSLQPSVGDFTFDNKISYLCALMCEQMIAKSPEHFRLAIITAYVKTGELERALLLIWEEKKLEKSKPSATKQAEDALKYLLYLVDVQELYKVALGTYDFGLVLYVAQKSQKDPKEFLRFLNDLKVLEPNYREFKVDEYLKRFKKALTHIAKCGLKHFDESLKFIKRYELYLNALQCYDRQAENKEASALSSEQQAEQRQCYQQVCLAYADFLRENGKLENASVMYERGGNIAQALASAKHVSDWRRALTLAAKDKATHDIGSFAISMVPSLQENGRYDEAYQLLSTYGSNAEQALQSLLKGKLFLKAIYEARLMQHKSDKETDLIASVITPDLIAYRQLLDSNLNADQQLFISYKQRLLAIREKKAKQKEQQQQFGGVDTYDSNDIDECDLLSDTTSMHSSRYTGSSRGTGKTFRSSKNRRKHERKLLSLKEGNPFEDIALIDALHNHIMKIVNEQNHIRDTCKALIELQQDEAAAIIQKRFKQLLTLLQESLDEIWIPEMMTAQQYLTGPNIDYTQLQNEQRYAMINPQKRFKPQLSIIDWQHEILKY